MHGGGLYANNPQEHGWTIFPHGKKNLPTDRTSRPRASTNVRRDLRIRLVTISRSRQLSPATTRQFLNLLSDSSAT
eukprot:1379746-Pyramimonas_sp.AAC.1